MADAVVFDQYAVGGPIEQLNAQLGALMQAGGLIPGTTKTGITAGTTRTQAGATALTKQYNRVDTSTAVATGAVLGDGVSLPVATPGAWVAVINNTSNNIQVYGNGADTVNAVTNTVGIAQLPKSIDMYHCVVAGAWFVESGIGFVGAMNTVLAADAITAAGTSQATGTQLAASINTVGTVASGTGVNLPASAVGLDVIVINMGANPLLVYPFIGATDTINGIAATVGVSLFPGSTATFNCTAVGAWTVQPATTKLAAFNTNSATAGATLTAANITGGAASVDLAMTGALGAGANAQLPTVAAMTLAMHCPTVGTSFRLRVCNQSSGNFAWTITTNTGWTVTGTMSIAQNTWREFVVTLTSLTTATIQNVAVGTFS